MSGSYYTEYSIQRRKICLEKNRSYTIRFSDSSSNGWTTGSYVKIVVGDFTIYKGSLSSGSSSTDTFYFAACGSNEIRATVIRQYSSFTTVDESFSLYKGDSFSRNLVLTKANSIYKASRDFRYSVCITKDQLYTVTYSGAKQGWPSNSNIYSSLMIVSGSKIIYGGRLNDKSFDTEVFTYTSCKFNEIEAEFIRHNSDYPWSESVALYDESVSSEIPLFRYFGSIEDDLTEYQYSICLEKDKTYTIEFSAINYWHTLSYAQISVGSTIIYRGGLAYGTFHNGTDSFMYPSCGSSKSEVTVKRRYTANPDEEHVSIHKGKTSSGALVFSKGGKEYFANTEYYYTICVARNQAYTVVYSDVKSSGWSPNSSLTIMSSDITVYFGYMASGNSLSDSFIFPSCQSDEKEVRLLRQFGADANIESFNLFKGHTYSSAAPQLKLASMNGQNYTSFTYSICIRKGQIYTVDMTSSSKDHWNEGSFVYIYDESYSIYKGYLAGNSLKVETFVYPLCKSTEIAATVFRSYGISDAKQESFILYKGEPSPDTQILSVFGTPTDNNKDFSYSVCLKKGQTYTIEYFDTKENGWKDDASGFSSLSILYGDKLIYGGYLNSGKYGVDTFIYQPCLPTEDEATITKQYNQNPSQEAFVIYKVSSSSNTRLLSVYGTRSLIGTKQSYSVCLERGQVYLIDYFDTGKEGWSGDYSLSIVVGERVIYRGTLSNGFTGSDTFYYPKCEFPDVEVTLIRQYGTNATQESVRLYQGSSSMGNLLFRQQGALAYEYGQYEYSICLTRGQYYYVSYADSDDYGWSIGSYVQIIANGFSLFKGYYESTEDSEDYSIFYYPLCDSNEVEARLVRQYGYRYAEQESFKLYKDQVSPESCILSINGTGIDDYEVYSYPICLAKDTIYTINYYNSEDRGWYGFSTVTIYVEDTLIYQGTLTSGGMGSDTFVYTPCRPNQANVNLVRVYSYSSKQESFKLYKGKQSSNKLLLEKVGSDSKNGGTFKYHFCATKGQIFSIEYSDSSNNGWSSQSLLYAHVDTSLIYQGTLASGSKGYDSFVYTPCGSNEVETTLYRQYGSDQSSQESFSIRKGYTWSSVIFSKEGTDAYKSGLYIYSLCLIRGHTYTIDYSDSGENGWSSSSFVHIKNNDITVFKGTLASKEAGSDIFAYPSCQSNEVEATLVRKYGSSKANEESFTIYKGSSSDTHVLTVHGASSDNYASYTYHICIARGQTYTIDYTDSGSNGWSSGSSVDIFYKDITIYKGTLTGEEAGSDIFSYPLCQSNEVEVTLTRQYGSSKANEESFTIYIGDPLNNMILINKEGTYSDNGKHYNYAICLQKNQDYSVVYVDFSRNGWQPDSYIHIMSRSFTIYKGGLEGGSRITDIFTFSPCLPNEIEATLIRTYGSSSYMDESFNIYKGDKLTGTRIMNVEGDYLDSRATYNYTLCLLRDQLYTIEYFHSSSNSWNGGYVHIVHGDITIYKGSLLYVAYESDTFSLPSCKPNQMPAIVVRQYGSNDAHQESFSIYDGPTPYDTRLLRVNGTTSEYMNTLRYPICIERGKTYYISYSDSYSDKWNSRSSLSIQYNNMTLFEGSLKSKYYAYNILIPYFTSCIFADGWDVTEVKQYAKKSCSQEQSNAYAAQYRECSLYGAHPYWGETHDEMCSLALSSGPEKGHAFAHFYLSCYGKSPASYTSQNIYSLYSLLSDYIESSHISIDGLNINIEDLSSYYNGSGSAIHFTVGTVQDEVDYAKQRIAEYLKTFYSTDILDKDTSFTAYPVVFLENQTTVVNGPLLTPGEVFLVVLLILILLCLCSDVAWYFLIHKKGKTLTMHKIFKHEVAPAKKDAIKGPPQASTI